METPKIRFACGAELFVHAAESFSVVRWAMELESDVRVAIPFRCPVDAGDLTGAFADPSRFPTDPRAAAVVLATGHFLCADGPWLLAAEKAVSDAIAPLPIKSLRESIGLEADVRASADYYNRWSYMFFDTRRDLLNTSQDPYPWEDTDGIHFASPRATAETTCDPFEVQPELFDTSCRAPNCCNCASCLKCAYPEDGPALPPAAFEAMSRGIVGRYRSCSILSSFSSLVRRRKATHESELFRLQQTLSSLRKSVEKMTIEKKNIPLTLRAREKNLKDQVEFAREQCVRHDLVRLHLFFTVKGALPGTDLQSLFAVPGVLLRVVSLGDWLERMGIAPGSVRFQALDLVRCASHFKVSLPPRCCTCAKYPPTSFWIRILDTKNEAKLLDSAYTRRYIKRASDVELSEFLRDFHCACASYGSQSVTAFGLCGYCVQRDEPSGGVGRRRAEDCGKRLRLDF